MNLVGQNVEEYKTSDCNNIIILTMCKKLTLWQSTKFACRHEVHACIILSIDTTIITAVSIIIIKAVSKYS